MGSFGDTIKNLLGLGDDAGPWSRNWVKAAQTFGEALGKYVLPILGLLGAFKLGRGILSKIPIVGRLFGGGNAKGTPTDPMYVVSMGGLGGIGGKIGKGLKGGARLLGKGILTALTLGGSLIVKGLMAAWPLLPTLPDTIYQESIASAAFLKTQGDDSRFLVDDNFAYATIFNQYFRFKTFGPLDVDYILALRETLV